MRKLQSFRTWSGIFAKKEQYSVNSLKITHSLFIICPSMNVLRSISIDNILRKVINNRWRHPQPIRAELSHESAKCWPTRWSLMIKRKGRNLKNFPRWTFENLKYEKVIREKIISPRGCHSLTGPFCTVEKFEKEKMVQERRKFREICIIFNLTVTTKLSYFTIISPLWFFRDNLVSQELV